MRRRGEHCASCPDIPLRKHSRQELGLEDAGEAPWEFDTVRGKSEGNFFPDGDASLLSVSTEDTSLNPTVRPNKSKLPPTLRMLFEDDTTDSAQPSLEPSFPHLSPAPLAGVIPSRARGRSRGATVPEPVEETQTAKKPSFVFPPRTSTPRSDAKVLLTSESEPDASGFDDIQWQSADNAVQSKWPRLSEEDPALDEPVATPRTASTDDGSTGDAEGTVAPIPPDDGGSDVLYHPLEATRGTSSSPKSLPIVHTPVSAPPIRKRSQSNTTDTASPAVPRSAKERNLMASIDFHFPPLSGGISQPSSAPMRWNPSDIDSVVPRRMPSPGSLLIRSAPVEHEQPAGHSIPSTSTQLPVSRRPSLSRLASVSGRETMQPSPITPIWSREDRDLHEMPTVPGLKDVLKVNFLWVESFNAIKLVVPRYPQLHPNINLGWLIYYHRRRFLITTKSHPNSIFPLQVMTCHRSPDRLPCSTNQHLLQALHSIHCTTTGSSMRRLHSRKDMCGRILMVLHSHSPVPIQRMDPSSDH